MSEVGDNVPGLGLSCRKCGCRDLRVIETRRGGNVITRRRACRHCGTLVTTREKLADDDEQKIRPYR